MNNKARTPPRRASLRITKTTPWRPTQFEIDDIARSFSKSDEPIEITPPRSNSK